MDLVGERGSSDTRQATDQENFSGFPVYRPRRVACDHSFEKFVITFMSCLTSAPETLVNKILMENGKCQRTRLLSLPAFR